MCSVLGLIPCFQISSQRPYPLDYLHPLKQTSTTSVTKKISSKRESAVKYLDQFWRENLGWKVILSGFEFKKLLLSNCLECKTTLSDTVVSNGLMVIFGSFHSGFLDSIPGSGEVFFCLLQEMGKKKPISLHNLIVTELLNQQSYRDCLSCNGILTSLEEIC